MAELFAEDQDRNATGNDLRKLSINIDSRFDSVDRRFDAVDRRFDEVDRRFNELRHDMNEGFNRIESRLTRGLINNIGWIIATNIAVFGTANNERDDAEYLACEYRWTTFAQQTHSH